MPTLIMSKLEGNLDGSVRAKTMAFLQKLGNDDTTPGLHIEPINGSADPRVRTGRIDKFWRAVLYRIDQNGQRHYVVHGVCPHDDATEKARRTRLTVNPINGLPQFEEVAFEVPVTAAPVPPPGAVPAPVAAAEPAVPLPVPPLVDGAGPGSSSWTCSASPRRSLYVPWRLQTRTRCSRWPKSTRAGLG